MKSMHFWRVRSTRVRKARLPDRTWQQRPAISASALDASLKLLQLRPQHRGSDAGTYSTTPCARSHATPKATGLTVAVSTYPQHAKPQFQMTTGVFKLRQTSLEVKRASPQVPRSSSPATSATPP